ncbi:CGNR zinc finger domain-containing protein [Sphaerisporangium corydalis]|uniref:CGNR zinc finger domain-containing protein n=1 Tax=Sphaerisporangium corydalis TaxID=1441875 RepID=A0ABV9E8G2_9ACTN|nr:CGNR zinc finger domain-containing protein [Sphaerisporangium corydalis]
MDGPAELLRDFVNTYDVEGDTDELASPAELAVWLRERGLISGSDRAVDDDWALAVHLREGLRTVLRHGHEAAPAPVADLDAALAALPVRVTLASGAPEAEPLGTGATRGLGLLVKAIMDARAGGGWHRLKVCASDTCQWAFIDASKNRSRAWCSMRVCGNRTKTRAYRARRQAPAPAS